MKTTVEVPEDLYRKVKAQASANKLKINDLLTEGLQSVLIARSRESHPDEVGRVLAALDDIMRCPPVVTGRIAELQEENRRLRLEGWSRVDSFP